jgi:hypothetical protein
MFPYAAHRWNTDIRTARAKRNVPHAPVKRWWTPSSCSMYCSTFFRVDSSISVTSGLISAATVPPPK